MGPVNIDGGMKNLNRYKSDDFLNKEHTDLVNAKDGLLKVIGKINQRNTVKFSDTFEGNKQKL